MSSKEAPRPGLIRAARDGKITNREGATALGISVRQFRRLRRRFEAEGAPGLIHRSRGRSSPKRIPEALRNRVAKLMRGRYAGFNDCHLAEMLVEREGLALSRAMIQRLRTELGLRAKRRRRGRGIGADASVRADAVLWSSWTPANTVGARIARPPSP